MTKGDFYRGLDGIANYVALPLLVIIVAVGSGSLAFEIHELPIIGSLMPFVFAMPFALFWLLLGLCFPRAPKVIRNNW